MKYVNKDGEVRYGSGYKDQDYQRKWYEAHPGYRARKCSEYYHNHQKGNIEYQGKRRNSHLLRKYDMTVEDWDVMFQSQDYKCKICKSSNPGSKKGWHTDHCHTTNKVRSILCMKCNNALHKDITPETLRCMADYIEGKI